MANLTGTINGTTSNAGVHVKLVWTETAVNTANNTSTVRCVLTYWRNDELATMGSGHYSITVAGQTKSADVYTILANSRGPQDVMDETFTVTHNSDGTKTAAISATGYISGTTVESTTLSGSAVLTTIPRTSTLTLSKNYVTMNGADAITLNVTRASNSFTHTIVATHADNLSKTVCTKDTGTSYSLTIPSSWCSNVPNSMSGGAWITITTYNGNTQIGQERYSFTINVPSYTLSPSISSAIASGGYGGYYIAGKSKTKLTASCSDQYGGSISSCVIKEGNTTLANGTTYTSGLLTTGSHNYTAYITDSRGITASVSTTITVHGYTTPTVTFSRTSVPMDGSTTQNITISNQDSIYYYSLLIQWANNSYSQVFDLGNTTAASITKSGITYPLTWNNGVPNATSGTASLKVYVRAGSLSGTVVEIVEKSFTLTVPSSVVPSTTISLTGQDLWHSLYVQNKSKVQITGTFTGSYGSTLASYKFYNGSTLLATQTSSATYTTGVLANSGSQTMKVMVTDSRGRTATATQAITVQVYFKPYINPYKAFRSDANGNAKDDGTYITVLATANYASLNGENSRTMKAATKASSASSYSNERTVTSGTATVMSGTYNVDDIYTVRFTVTDAYGSTGNTVYVSVSSVYVGIVYDRLHKAVGVNTYPPSDGSSGLFTGKLGARFDGPIYIASKSGDSAVDGWKLLNNSMIFRGLLTGDMNDYFMPGVYYVGSTLPSNYPTNGVTWSNVLILNNNGSAGTSMPVDNAFCRQIVIGGTQAMYERVYAGNPASWGAWHTYFSSSGNDGRYLPLNGGGTVNGNIEAVRSGTNATVVVAENDNGRVAIESATNRGLYDATLGQWFTYRKQDTSDTAVYVPTDLKVNNQYKVLSEGYTGYGFRGAALSGKAEGTIPDNTNFNDLWQPGTYFVRTNASADTMTNMPIQKAGALFVLSGNGNIGGGAYSCRRQIYVVALGNDDIPTRYERHGNTNAGTTFTWTAWRTITEIVDATINLPTVTQTGNIYFLDNRNTTASTYFRTKNSYCDISLHVGTNCGVYDHILSNWLIRRNFMDGIQELRGNASSMMLGSGWVSPYVHDTGWQQDPTMAWLKYRRIDNHIYLALVGDSVTITTGAYRDMGTLPEQYRPTNAVYSQVFVANTSTLILVYINTAGKIQMRNTSSNNTVTFRGSIEYPGQTWRKTSGQAFQTYRILSYNVGMWTNGTREGMTAAEYSAKIAGMKQLFDQIAPTIGFFTEYREYIDAAKTHLARTDLFPSATYTGYSGVSGSDDQDKFKHPVVVARTPLGSTGSWFKLTTSSQNYCYRAVVTLSGYSVVIYCAHLHPAALSRDIRDAEVVALLNRVKTEDNVIICGDFNFVPASYHNLNPDSPNTDEHKTEFAKFKNAGFEMANGDFIPWVGTWPSTNDYPAWATAAQQWYLDNILVKGRVKLFSASVPVQAKNYMMSDHLPIVATIGIIGE